MPAAASLRRGRRPADITVTAQTIFLIESIKKTSAAFHPANALFLAIISQNLVAHIWASGRDHDDHAILDLHDRLKIKQYSLTKRISSWEMPFAPRAPSPTPPRFCAAKYTNGTI
ncbi:MAG TPA: hypothetical protein VGC16_07075 [Rhizomicrobium sp.]